MSSLLESLMGQLGGDNMATLSRQIGADEKSTSNAVTAALPMLLGALTKNSQDSNGASALAGALERDHDGGLLDNLSGFLKGGDTGMGAGILKHMLGGKQQKMEAGIAKSSGMDMSAVTKLLPMLAPMLMGALGKQKKSSGFDASALAGMLKGEAEQVEKKAGKSSGFLAKMLDQDGDGDLDMGDLAKGVLGKLF